MEMTERIENVSTDFQNLDDDMVKLVAYAIVSVRRGHERILDGGEGTLLVTGRMTRDTFTAFIIGRYLQKEISNDKEEAILELISALNRYLLEGGEGDTRRFAQLLKDYLQESLSGRQVSDKTRKKKFRQIPDEDRSLLRVHFVVSNRWLRQPEKFEEEQVAVLEGISKAIAGKGK
jgi:hypothetical protein